MYSVPSWGREGLGTQLNQGPGISKLHAVLGETTVSLSHTHTRVHAHTHMHKIETYCVWPRSLGKSEGKGPGLREPSCLVLLCNWIPKSDVQHFWNSQVNNILKGLTEGQHRLLYHLSLISFDKRQNFRNIEKS